MIPQDCYNISTLNAPKCKTPSRRFQMKKIIFFTLIALIFSTAVVADSTHNGKYVFDTEAFMAAMITLQPEMAGNEMAQNMIKPMMESMRGFSITIKDDSATISLQQGMASGKLEKVSEANGSTVYKMTSEQDKDLLITVTGDTLMAGPEGADPRQMMHFKKEVTATVPVAPVSE